MESAMGKFVKLLGDGWTLAAADAADGYVTGPGGERFWVDLRDRRNGTSGPSFWLRQQVYTEDGIAEVNSPAGTGAQVFADVVKAAYPQLAQRHAANLALIEDILAPIREFAAEVAAHLGDGWTAKVGHSGSNDDTLNAKVTLIDAQGREVYWRWGSYGQPEYKGPFLFTPADKWTIRGSKDGGTKLYAVGYRDSSIGLSAKHTPKRVAGEITRRLLPDYYAAFSKAVDRDHADAVYIKTRDAAAAALNKACPALNVHVPGCRNQDGPAEGYMSGLKLDGRDRYTRVDAQVSGSDGGQVTLEFHNLPVGAAKALLEAWEGIVAAQGEGAPAEPQAPAVLVEVSGGCVQNVFAKGLPEGTELCVVDYDNDEDENGNPADYSASCWHFDVEPDAEARDIFRETAGRDW
jgi:hypothetical protein